MDGDLRKALRGLLIDQLGANPSAGVLGAWVGTDLARSMPVFNSVAKAADWVIELALSQDDPRLLIRVIRLADDETSRVEPLLDWARQLEDDRDSWPAGPTTFEPTPPSDQTPVPNAVDEHEAQLIDAFEAAVQQRQELAEVAMDTTEIDSRILDIRRQLHRGPELTAGTKLGAERFQLVREIGRGGFATVWESWDHKLEQKVALKVMHSQFLREQERRERFERGARKMAELRHPHITQVLTEPITEAGWTFFAMELAEGGDLRAAVLEQRIAPEDSLRLLSQIADALDFSHQLGIVHRDVKPANILLTHDSHAKLTDFDLVRALGSTAGTRTQAGLGTYHYAAPEAMDTAKEAGPACDIYSLAATAVFCLGGESLGGRFLFERAAFLSELGIPEKAQEVLSKGLAYSPEHRPESAAALVGALEKAAFPTRSLPDPEPVPAAQIPEPGAESPGPGAVPEPEILPPGPIAPRDPVKPTSPMPPQNRISEADQIGAVPEPPALPPRSVVPQRPGAQAGSEVETPKTSGPLLKAVVGSLVLVVTAGLIWRYATAPNGQAPSTQAGHEASSLDAALILKDPTCKPTEWTDDHGIEWISVCAGTFTMGAPTDEPYTDDGERPQRRVTLPAFSLMKYEVTHEQYKESHPDHRSWWDKQNLETAKRPVTDVDWHQASTFCNQVDSRLPTEAEWEYVARAGTTTPWSHGSDESSLKDFAVYGRAGEKGPVNVGARNPNPWGFYDLHGNVWEWVQDWYGPYLRAAQEASTAPERGTSKVLRGGSFANVPRHLRSAFRIGHETEDQLRNLGFRCARGPAPPIAASATTTRSTQNRSAEKEETSVDRTLLTESVTKDPNGLLLEDSTCKPTPWTDDHGIEWISVCSGTFTMGAPTDEPYTEDDERPQRRVTLPAFSLMKYEVTHEQYKKSHPDHRSWWDRQNLETAKRPVTDVDWHQASTFCNQVDSRLPTEAEWEYAARAGTTTPWSHGSDESRLKDFAVYGRATEKGPVDVGAKKPNPWGFYDLHGNVWEWVQDWYGPYLGTAQEAPTGPEKGMARVLRGGSFAVEPGYLRSADRDGLEPGSRNGYLGFRCARGPAPPPLTP